MSRQGQQQCANPSEIDRSYQAGRLQPVPGSECLGRKQLSWRGLHGSWGTQAPCMWGTAGPSLPLTASSKDLSCSSREIPASCSTRQHFCCWRWTTRDLGFFCWDPPIALWFRIGSCPQELSKAILLTPHATAIIFTQRDQEKTTTLVHCLQHITSRICKRSGWTINPNVNLTNFRCSGPVTPCSDISQVLHVCLDLLWWLTKQSSDRPAV